ncbi:MAG: PAS domain-containing sensor histidine kinase [Winogradskyella sp.]|uniref:PAS domain-containing sensor histidine kinase n=1 Tax=Winogradskyella sp. TaxID=1883156 RepID=UPI000F413DCE|nr:PAS domain-containing sensor histidine kinase [Winogradskyella sp.]RNC87745.1 MAG: PAS domain-containing sensor histidine kinase [Winogradskyella sp.]
MFQQNQDIFKVLLGSVSEGVIIVDEKQIIVEANEAANTMFGYAEGELIKQSLNVLIPQNYHAGHGKHFDGFMKKKERRQMGQGRDIFGAHKDGSTFPVEAGLNPFSIYGKNYVMALVIDVSIRKAQEQKIQELNSELEEKVKARTKELGETITELKQENKKRLEAEEDAKEALKKEKELNELKTKFLSMVSHEFKTPLSGILTSTMLLSKYKLTEQQEKRDKHIKTISNKVHYLNNILNDFLSVEKLEKGKVLYKPTMFKLSKVVNEVVYNANMLLKDGQRINYPEDIDNISLYQDEKIVELALSNLVHNAIKYSSENTVIDISISQNKNITQFKVKDNGIGIPKKDQKNIFNRYFRAENALLTQGTGIGLNIVKDHLENLKGRIYFESEPEKETIFTIEIPNRAEQ